MGESCVLPSKVHQALALEQVSGIVVLVGGEQGKSPQAVRVQAPLLYQAPCPQGPNVLPVDLHQVVQNHRHELRLCHPLEEGGVVRAGVGRQEGASICAGEAVAGVVDEAGGPVGHTLPSPDALALPEALPEAEHHLRGAGIVDGAQGFHLVPGEWRLEVDEEAGLGRGRHQDVVHSQVVQCT